MDLTRIFSLKTRPTFFLLVAALCLFSIGSWWSVRMLIWSEVRARLDSNADRILESIRNGFSTHASILVHVRAHLSATRASQRDRLGSFVDQLDLPVRYPGTLGIGYAPLLTRGELRPFREKIRQLHPDLSPEPAANQEFFAPIEMIEPLDWRNRKAIGFDMLSEERRRQALMSAARTNQVSLSDPVRLIQESDADVQSGMLMYLPIYRDGAPTEGVMSDPLRQVRGFVYVPLRVRDFFEGIFGSPSLTREAVNYVISTGPSAFPGFTVYNRFDISEREADTWMVVERRAHLFGKEVRLRVYPLSHFYSFADRYLALIVGLGAALLSCLVMIVMRVSQNQLEFETLAKESSMEAAQQSRKQVENLRRLNEFDSSLAGELEEDALVRKFFRALNELTQVDASFLFFSKRPSQSKMLFLRDHQGVEEASFRVSNVPMEWVERVSTQSLYLRRSDHGSDEVLQRILSDTSVYSDWVLAVVSTREAGRCGLIFAARTSGARFSEVDLQLFESMISQFASCMEIAQLFSRVEDASRAKNAFLANMSHEIRTPLSAIIGFSEMLVSEGVSPAQKESISANIRKNGEQLTAIIDDILDLAKVEAGKMKIERRRVRLASVIHEIKSVMELRARSKGIQFRIETAGPLPSHLQTDEVRLKQILMNLVGNAIKFTERGSVQMIVRHLLNENREPVLVFTIKDTGIGISDEAQIELFRPFSQGDTSTTRKFGGSGLGLALSKRLAQELGGDVALLDSIKGQGSTFELRIASGDLTGVVWTEQLFPKMTPVPEAAVRDLPNLDGAKILVVEDSEDNQEIFRYFLESSGAETEIVANGLQAVSAASEGRYDMILMDIQIPGIDGKEATRRIRQRGFGKPIVALTAHAMPEEQESCIRAGCNGQITKPVSGEALVSQVAEYLGRA
jgi:signal transduction histidine kinase/CHASE1-domain containing sensor protein/CheY-like chemotaxis protein